MLLKIKSYIYIFCVIVCTALFSCEPEGGRGGSPNAPEIVDRDADTTFNKVPGEAHHGIETYEEAEEAEEVTTQ